MKDLFRIDNEIAVVTGAFGRLGPAWCEALLSAGATVVALDRPEARPSDRITQLQARYGMKKLWTFQADVLDRAALETVCDQVKTGIGIASVLVNNAGIDQPPSAARSYRIEDIPEEAFRGVLDVNVYGLFQVTQVFAREMVRQKRGSIINIGSLYAEVSPDGRLYDHIDCDPPFLKPPAYGASKAAVVNLTKYLSTHWAPYGVRVNTLSPGGVLGGQDEKFKEKFCAKVPMGRMALHDDLMGPLIFLASPASSYVTGVNLRVDGGFTVW